MDSQAPAGGTAAAPEYSRQPGARVFLAPARVVERMIPWTRARLSESLFMRVSSALGWVGAQAIFIAGAAALVYMMVLAIRTDSLSLAVLALLAPVATAVLQYSALRFATQGEGRVRSTPTQISSHAIFELLGIALAMLGAAIMAMAIVEMVRNFDRDAVGGLIVMAGSGYLLVIVGALFLNPAIINVHEHDACTLGQDGLAIVGAMFKAILAGARLMFGSAAAAGAVASLSGCIWSIFAPDELQPHLTFTVGTMAVVAAALLPLYAYVASAIYFVLVDVLDALIRLRRPS